MWKNEEFKIISSSWVCESLLVYQTWQYFEEFTSGQAMTGCLSLALLLPSPTKQLNVCPSKLFVLKYFLKLHQLKPLLINEIKTINEDQRICILTSDTAELVCAADDPRTLMWGWSEERRLIIILCNNQDVALHQCCNSKSYENISTWLPGFYMFGSVPLDQDRTRSLVSNI